MRLCIAAVVLLAGCAPAAAERRVANQVAFARLYGYVRHFHPADQAQGVKWEPVVAAGMREVADAPDAAALAERLRSRLRPYAPTLQVFAGDRPPSAAPLDPAAPQRAYYKRASAGGENRTYAAERVFQPAAQVQAEAFEADLGAGVRCRLPLVVAARGGKTLPAGSPVPLPSASPDVQATRLATVAIAWNAAQHFFPYFEETQVDWPAALPVALRAAEAPQDEDAFGRVLERMWKGLQDGHGRVTGVRYGSYRPDLQWAWIEDRLIVTRVGPSLAGKVAPGDEVTAIDGRPALARIEEEEALVCGATPRWIRRVALRRVLAGARDRQLALSVRTAGGTTAIAVPRKTWVETEPAAPQLAPLTEVRPGVFYLSLGRATAAEFEAALPRLTWAKGLILDSREYPNPKLDVWKTVMPRLTKVPLQSPPFRIPVTRHPDRQAVTWEPYSWSRPPRGPYIGAKLAFLADGGSISQQETLLAIVRHHKLGAVVGESTAGTNGDIDWLDAGHYRFYWTGLKILNYDGSRFHCIGVDPTVKLKPAIADMRQDPDATLTQSIVFTNAD